MMREQDDMPVAAAIEELDVPLRGAPARALRWEGLLGLLLVLGLSGFSLGQWWDQQSRAEHYRAGTRAAAILDWDTARSEFAAATGYADADTRRAGAQRNITTRERQYAAALAATGRSDWVGALAALQPLQTIAPHYRDATVLAANSLQAAATAALTGAVALRLQAEPPGLYRFGATGWQRLLDSDRESRVRAACPGGAVLYDVAAWPGTGTPVLPAPPGDAGAGGWSGMPRQLLLDAPAGAWRGRLTVDPDPRSRYLCTTDGVWTLRPSTAPGAGAAIPALALYYQDFVTGRRVAPVLPGPGSFVAAIQPQAGGLILADVLDSAGQPWHTRLAIARLDGSGFKVLLDQPGLIVDCLSDPDGPYVLATLLSAGVGGTGTYTTFLLDTTAKTSPHAVAAVTQGRTALAPISGFQATFLQHPARAGQVLLRYPEGDRQAIRLLDLRQPDHPLLDAQVTAAAGGIQPPVANPADGSLLLLNAMREDGDPAEVSGVQVTPQNTIRPVQFAIPAFGNLWVRAGRVLSLNMWSYGTNDPWHLTLYSQPLAGSPPDPPDRAIYSATQQLAGDPIIPLRIAPNWLVYAGSDGTLHGRSYDGTLDMPLPWTATGFPIDDLWAQP
jgi:hypothetical protein